MNAADQWYYLAGTETRGPVPASEIVRLIRSGSLPPATQVAQAGWQTWSPASAALSNLLGGAQAPAAPIETQPAYAIKLQCVSGPDAGKACMIGAAEVSLGRASGIGENDPGVAQNHIAVSWQNNVIHFRTFPGALLRVAGNPVTQGTLSNGQQFQMGASTWQVGSAPVELSNLLANLGARLNKLTDTEKLEGFSLKTMFSEVFQKRQRGEIEDYFLVGTAKTTPPLDEVQTGWPRPWFFMRVLLFMASVYFVFWESSSFYGAGFEFAGTLVMGALTVPLATVVFLWEMNTPRNVTFIQVLMLVAIGGAVSLLMGNIVRQLSHVGWVGPPSAGFVEETAKLLTVILLVRSVKHKYLLNGIVFGAAVGAGFEAFETAGYAFYVGYLPQLMHNVFNVAAMNWEDNGLHWNDIVSMYSNHQYLSHDDLMNWAGGLGKVPDSAYDQGFEQITGRAWTAFVCHPLWTAITAGAFWRVKGGDPFKLKMLADPAFIRVLLIPVVLHAAWDMPWDKLLPAIVGDDFQRNPSLYIYAVYIPLGVIGWYVAFRLIQQGLRQIKEAQLTHIKTEYTHARETLTSTGKFHAQRVVR